MGRGVGYKGNAKNIMELVELLDVQIPPVIPLGVEFQDVMYPL